MHRPRWLLLTALFTIVACSAAAGWRQYQSATAPELTPDPTPKAHSADPVSPTPEPAEVASEPVAHATPTSKVAAPVATSAAAGMVVAIDPETGQLGMPSVEQLRELFPPGTSVAQTPDGFVVTHRPDGSVSIDVGNQLQEYSFVHIGPDGKRVQGCAPAPADLRTIRTVPAPHSQYEER
jgi:hypothetical protein